MSNELEKKALADYLDSHSLKHTKQREAGFGNGLPPGGMRNEWSRAGRE